ncbi:M56 family metallopeptidase [Pyxidicoccus xibeiensis]|uniref:M56 family metallopeptidase n=1 Tax=Pyxidicoccus xibeiensis TaxID=2906759 RepID=UPI0020A78494|nr:M56 family metallopeptidase [Pyxidicoccus xibeiensis]MCP3136842.1 M48 family metalloprotease [Pyxidicoccus xibeiensis]
MSNLLMESLGWALLHSLWQVTLVAVLLAVALAVVGRRAAHARYALACGALVLALVLPVVAGWRHYSAAQAPVSMSVEDVEVEGAPGLTVAVAAPWVTGREVPARTYNDAGSRAVTPAGEPLLERVRSAVAEHLAWLVLAWVAGVAVCSGRLAAEWVKLRQLSREALPAPVEWQARLDALAQKLGLGRAVRLLQSSSVDVPAAVGWLAPVVLLPVSALSGLSTRQLEMVLAHELAHIRRHDFAVNLAQVLVETLLFFHPAVRWVSHVIRVEREHCCDDIAVGASGGAVSYARALTALEALRVLPETPSTAMSALGGSLPERVRRLVSAPATRCSSRWVAGASVLTLVSSLAVAAPLTSLVLSRTAEKSSAEGADAPDSVAASEPSLEDAVSAPASTAAPAPARMPSLPTAPALAAAPAPARVPSLPDAVSTPAPASPRDAASVPPPPDAVSAPAAPPAPPAPARAGVASAAMKQPLPSPTVIAPVPGALGARPTPTPAPTPTPSTGNRDDDDADERTRVGTGQPLSVDQLVALKVAGVTPARVQELESMGYAPTVANLVQMGHAGVTPEYTRDMNARFGRKLDADDLVQLKHLGVTPAYIESLKAAGFATNDPDDLVQARAVGVDDAYIRGLKAAGYSGMPLEDLAHLRAVGVSPEYIQALGQRGLSKVKPDDLVQLRAVGVTPEWLDQMRSAGVQTKDADELTQLRALGVDPAFLRELRDAGLKDLSVDELVRLRSGGVDADFIRKLRDSRSK